MKMRQSRLVLRCALVSWLAVSAAGTGGCFGTGVSGVRATSGVLLADNVVLVPPAPAKQSVVLRNLGGADLELESITVPAAASVTIDSGSCEGYPLISAEGQCVLLLTAAHDAVPGVYPVAFTYRTAGRSIASTSQVIVESGSLSINEGRPIAIDALDTVTPITVTNNGFDLKSVDLSVNCSTAGGNAVCTLEPNDCAHGLLANATCQALLSASGTLATGASVAAGSSATDATAATGCVAPISVGTLSVSDVVVSAPGTQAIVLTNPSSRPISLRRLALNQGAETGITLGLNGPNGLACQQFTGTCQVSLTTGTDAVLPFGAGALVATYSQDGADHVTGSSLLLDNRTAISFPTGAGGTVRLPSSTGQLPLIATNMGPFVWHGASLTLEPALAGVTLTTTCDSEVPPGGQFRVTATSSTSVVEGATSSLTAHGDNLLPPTTSPLAVGHSLLVTGTDAAVNGNAFLATSYDGGNQWTTRSLALVDAIWQGALFDGDFWTTVGATNGNQTIATSRDRGATWSTASLPAEAGTLYGAAGSGGLYLAVGADGSGQALVRSSTDQGSVWSNAQGITGTAGAAYAIATNGTAWVAGGGSGSKSWLATSLDGGQSWQAVQPGSGQFYAVGYDGQAWLAVGSDGNGQPLLFKNAAVDAPTNNWTGMSTLSSQPATFRALSFNGTQWLVVGDSGGQRVAMLGTTNATTFAPFAAIGPGIAYGVALHDGAWQVAGMDASTGHGVVDRTVDGQSFASTALPAAAELTGICSR